MQRHVPLWQVGLLVAVAWITGRLLGAATGSMVLILGGGAIVPIGGYALTARTSGSRRDFEEKAHAEDPDAWVREALPAITRGSMTPEDSAAHVGALFGMLAAGLVLYGISALHSWSGQPSIGQATADELLPIACVPIVYYALYDRALERIHRFQRERQRRWRAQIRRDMAAIRARPPEPVTVIGWRRSYHVGFVVLMLSFVATLAVLFLSAGGDVGDLWGFACLTVFAITATWINVGVAIGRPVALRIDSDGIDVVQQGATPWAHVRGCALLSVTGMRSFVVIPHVIDTPSSVLADWMAAKIVPRSQRSGCTILRLRMLHTSAAALAVALERLGHPLVGMS